MRCLCLLLLVALAFERTPASLAQDDDRRELVRWVPTGNIAEVQRLLDAGVDPNVARGDEQTVLMVAAANGEEAIVRLLLERGASIDHPVEGNDATALHYARGVPVVEALLEAGADPDASSSMAAGGTPLRIAAERGEADVARVLLDAGADPDLHVPLQVAGPEIARLLLEAGADPNGRISSHSGYADGQSLLMAALRRGRAERVRLLLDAGADLIDADAEGMTVLMYALRHGNDAVVDAALEAGADLTARTDEGLNVLMLAAGLGRTDLIRRALDAGADLEEGAEISVGPGTMTATPLTMAAMQGQTDAVRLLLEAGADPNAVDAETGIGPLAAAAVAGHASTVHRLLEAGADPEPTLLGVPLVEAAAEQGHDLDDLVAALLRGRGDEPAIQRAVAMAEEVRTIAQDLLRWMQKHSDDPRLESLNSDAGPDDMNQLFGIAGLSSGDGPLVGEHGTYSMSVDGVIGTAPDTDVMVKAMMQRREVTVQVTLPQGD